MKRMKPSELAWKLKTKEWLLARLIAILTQRDGDVGRDPFRWPVRLRRSLGPMLAEMGATLMTEGEMELAGYRLSNRALPVGSVRSSHGSERLYVLECHGELIPKELLEPEVAPDPLALFREALADWEPNNRLAEGETEIWSVNPDGSITITLPSVLAANLADTLITWERHGRDWMSREDCKNWKRSPFARENRRETIVYSNNFGEIATVLGRRQVRALMERIVALDTRKENNDEEQ